MARSGVVGTLVLLALLGTWTAGAVAASGPLSDVLNLYIWTEYMPESVLTNFEKEFGVHVNYDTYSSNEELLAKLQAGATGYDVIVPSDYMVDIMIKMGLLEPIDKSNLPNLKNIGPQFLNRYFDPGNRYTVPYMWGTSGLVYNVKYVKEPVTSWNVLWDPRYKGRVILLDDSRENLGMVLQSLGYSPNETDLGRLQEAARKFEQLVPSVLTFDSDSPKTKLITEEAWIGKTWNAEAALASAENPNIRYTIPLEGATRWQDNLAIPKGAPHKYTAEVFINYILRPDVAAAIANAFPYGSPNVAARSLIDPKWLRNPAVYPPDEWLARTEFLRDVGDATVHYDEIYTEARAKAGR